MRHTRREDRPSGMFYGAERTRLLMAVLMLFVLAMLIAKAREADNWRWLVGEPSAQAKEPSQKAAKELPPATGPTDEVLAESEEAKNEYQVLTDGTLGLSPEEMEPYNRLVSWVNNQSFARLRARARSDLLFTHFHDEPDQHRGQLVTMELTVRRIIKTKPNRDGIPLHEICGYSKESGNRLYWALIVDLPKGMPIGPSVHEKARFAGYFLKLQGYQAADAKPGANPERAPLLIGRLEWTPAAAPKPQAASDWLWLGVLLLLLGAAWCVGILYAHWRRKKYVARPWIPDAAPGEVISIEKWLEQGKFNSEDEPITQSSQTNRDL
jgi:hypothetical protein